MDPYEEGMINAYETTLNDVAVQQNIKAWKVGMAKAPEDACKEDFERAQSEAEDAKTKQKQHTCMFPLNAASRK